MTWENNASFFLAYPVPTLTASFFSAFPTLLCPFGVCALWAHFSQLKYVLSINSNCSQRPVNILYCVHVLVKQFVRILTILNLKYTILLKQKQGTIVAGWEPGCLCFCFWLLLTWVGDKVTALIFKESEMQFDPLVIIKMQELEIHVFFFSNLLSLTQLPQAAFSR